MVKLVDKETLLKEREEKKKVREDTSMTCPPQPDNKTKSLLLNIHKQQFSTH